MSQPNDRKAQVSAPGKIDASLGEFWVGTPWEIFQQGHNLSCFERKRVYLNVPGKIRGRDFIEISTLTGADNDSDGRSVVAGDFRNNGQLDLVVRQVGGGPVLLYENHFPKRHYLKVSLRGTKSNRDGVGAKITRVAGGMSQFQQKLGGGSYSSASDPRLFFGLGKATKADVVRVVWPSGRKDEFTNLPAGQFVSIKEGSGIVATSKPAAQNKKSQSGKNPVRIRHPH